MIKQIPFLILLFALNISFAQEICDNGIDDDADGLIDLNDTTDCKCTIPKEITKVPSLIPNHSFEEKTSCPTNYSQMNRLKSWKQASNSTSDYYNTCGIRKPGIPGFLLPPDPLPDGDGYVGFLNGSIANSNTNYKEYVGTCLLDTLHAGEPYQIEVYMSLGLGNRTTNLTIYGTEDCSNLPFGGSNRLFGCPTNGSGWVQLDNIKVTLSLTEWTKVTFQFTPTKDITAIVLGPNCAIAISRDYYYIDNLVLNKTSNFNYGASILDSGNLCFGNRELIAKANYPISSYQWFKGGIALVGETSKTLVIKPEESGMYSVRINSLTGCTVSPEHEMFVNNEISYDVEIVEGCNLSNTVGEIKLVNVKGGTEPYKFSIGDSLPKSIGEFTSLPPGNYKVKVMDKNNCADSTWVGINLLTYPKVSLEKDSIFCDSIHYVLAPQTNTNNLNYTWSTLETSEKITAKNAGSYWVKVENKCGVDQDTILLTQDFFTPFTNLGKDTTFCDAMPSFKLNIGRKDNDESYLWSDGSILNEFQVSSPGKYWVKTENSCGTILDTIIYGLGSSPIIDLGPDTPLCGTFSFPLDAGIPGMSYLWEPYGESTQVIQAQEQGFYKVLVTDEDGCFGEDEFEITDSCKSYFYIPNAFTPNGDGRNDLFITINKNIYDYKLTVFNRWGENIFTTTDQTVNWDGTYQGSPVQQGVYFYVLIYKRYENKRVYNVNGNIHLLR